MNLARMAKHNQDTPNGPRPWHPKRKQPKPGDRMRKQVRRLAKRGTP